MTMYRSPDGDRPSRRGRPSPRWAALLTLLPIAASAQVVLPPPPPAVVGAFSEPGRFQLRNPRINGQPAGPGAPVVLPSGGRVVVDVDFSHGCPGCGGAVNQIIIGLAGEGRAQACIYSGGAFSGGWRPSSFYLNVPDRPGTYEVRARYAQATSCSDALGWWRVDRPQGPDASSTIATIAVNPPPPSPSVTPGGRSAQAIREEIEGRLAWIDEVGARLGQAARAPGGATAPVRLGEIGPQLRSQVAVLRQLQIELASARRDGGLNDPWRRRRDDLPPPPPPPPGMDPAGYDALLARLRDEPFERYRVERLRDALSSGARLSAAQAVGVVEEFDFAAAKTQVAVLLCGAVVEPALPSLTAALPYESNRQELRARTAGRCGP